MIKGLDSLFSLGPGPVESIYIKKKPSCPVSSVALPKIATEYRSKDSVRDFFGSLALKIPSIMQIFRGDIQKEYLKFCLEWDKKFRRFGDPVTSLPEKGWTDAEILGLIKRYSDLTNDELFDKCFSGTIYPSLLTHASTLSDHLEKGEKEMTLLESLRERLHQFNQRAYQVSYLWNLLHGDEFAIGAFLHYQVVQMTASQFAGDVNEVQGFVTSGSDESVMIAARAYRNWGMRTRDLKATECVIIAPDTVDKALLKACKAYEFQLVLIPTDENGNVYMVKLEEQMLKHKEGLVTVFASAPSIVGNVDPIRSIAELATKYECGMHVDARKSGFILPYTEIDSDFLAMDGVTSLSVDLQEHAMVPLGASTLIMRNLGEENLSFDAIYAIPHWSGGVYGSPMDAGSLPVVNSFHSLNALLTYGQEGYRTLSEKVLEVTEEIKNEIDKFYAFEVIGTPGLNVIAFKISFEWTLNREKLIYPLAREMRNCGFILYPLPNKSVNIVITGEMAHIDNVASKFIENLKEKWSQVSEAYSYNRPLIKEPYLTEWKRTFPGINFDFSEGIPENGWSDKKIFSLLNEINKAVIGYESESSISWNDVTIDLSEIEPCSPKAREYIRNLGERLENLFTYAYSFSSKWTRLETHSNAIGGWINRTIVSMVARMFGGKPDQVRGVVTSGGTESLMVSARTYRDWGMKEKKIKQGECVIIAPRSIHAALMKAAESYHIKLILCPTDLDGEIDLKVLEEEMTKHKENLVAVYASFPSYPAGIVDDISRIALLAKKHNCGFHVDSCLGGFVANFLPHLSSWVFDIDGVTSVSEDSHKNGHAPKGSSEVEFIAELFRYVFYDLGEWNWPEDVDARQPIFSDNQCVNGLAALIAMVAIGQSGYRLIARSIHQSLKELSGKIKKEFPEEIAMIAEPQVNVGAFQIDERMGLRKGATYELANQMKKRGTVLNCMQDGFLHQCVTARFVAQEGEKGAVDQFIERLRESFLEVIRLNNNGAKFSGDAPIYSTLSQASNPDTTLGVSKFVENFFFGKEGARWAVKKFFQGSLRYDPMSKIESEEKEDAKPS